MLDLRGKHAMARHPGHSGGEAPSPTLHSLARAFAREVAVGFGRDEASRRAGYAAARHGPVQMADCPAGMDRLSFYLGILAWRTVSGGSPP